MDYFCRITVPYSDQLQKAFNDIKNEFSSIIVYEHPAEGKTKQIHCHFYVKDYIPNIETMKNRIRAHIQCGKGNKFWSFKSEKVDQTCISYMSKGKYDPKFFHGIDTKTIEDLKALGYAVEDKVKIHEYDTKNVILPSMPIPERKKYTTRQIVDLIADEVSTNTKISYPDLIKVIGIVLRRINVTTNHHKICELVCSYRLYYDQDTWLDEVTHWYGKKYM